MADAAGASSRPSGSDVLRGGETLRNMGSAFGRARLRTLVSLRWLAIGGQLGAVLIVHFLLGFELPLAACLAAIGASAWVNVALMALFPAQHLASSSETAGQLAFDIVQLAVLIGLTGGLQNPFLLMILAPVTVGASRLLPAYAALLSLLALSCCVGMSVLGLELPWREGEGFQLPVLYQAGQLAAIGIGLLFFSVSAWRTGRGAPRFRSRRRSGGSGPGAAAFRSWGACCSNRA